MPPTKKWKVNRRANARRATAASARLHREALAEVVEGLSSTSPRELSVPPNSTSQTEVETELQDDDWSEEYLNQPLSSIQSVLRWCDGAGDSLRSNGYSGVSKRSEERRRAQRRELEAAAAQPGQSTLAKFFTGAPWPSAPTRSPTNPPSSATPPEPLFSRGFPTTELKARVELLKSLLNPQKPSSMPTTSVLKHASVLTYYREILGGKGRMDASRTAAKCIVNGESLKYKARSVRAWGDLFFACKAISQSLQGKHQKTVSLIDDEDIQASCLAHLRALRVEQVSPAALLQFVNEELLPGLPGAKSTICIRTATNWLHMLKFRLSEVTKGVYLDGHEREDVVSYRTVFLERMGVFLPLFSSFVEAETGEMVEVAPTLQPGQKRHVFVVHDESIFSAFSSNR
jgi:hypothetical protein